MKYFDHYGEEIGYLEWTLRMNDDKEVRVACDTVGDFTVSTVWTGMHLDYHPTDQILIFETMMFEDGDPLDCVKWPTLAVAIEGHKRTVEQLKLLGFTAIAHVKPEDLERGEGASPHVKQEN